ncbi:MAG: efflux RND transporter periplasmic adaptor subunit [Anaerolineales bacterium]|nr:efflux RND transporter periplasmic adaptor subunit [Anaerolineales bacterium]
MNKNKKRTFWIILILLLAAGGGAYAYFNYFAQPVQAAVTETPLQTAVARQGDLAIYASGAGTVVASTEMGVGFDESGTLTELLVTVGDEVEAGEVLARLQTNNSEEDIATAIADAELNVLLAQQALDDLVNADVSLSLAQAQLAVIEAQTALEEATSDRELMNYQRCLDSTLDDYEATYYDALDFYNQLAERYERDYASRPGTDPDKLQAKAQLEAAEEAVQAALINVNWCKNPYSEEEKAEGDAQVNLAQVELLAAQAEVESWQNYPDPIDVAVAEAQLSSAQAKLAEAQETQPVLELVAPISGTVLEINATVGEDVGTAAIVTIANLSEPMLQVYLDETDFDKAIVGYDAEVVFDAYPDDLFTGKVVQVNPSLSSTQGGSLVTLYVQLDPLTIDQPQRLPLGMSATVDVIAGSATNAVLVPVEALRDLGDGSYAVFVVENDQPVLRVVTIGINDLTYVEITSGLEAGEVVTTGIVETE